MLVLEFSLDGKPPKGLKKWSALEDDFRTFLLAETLNLAQKDEMNRTSEPWITRKLID
jgi:hypothetical protein